MKPGLLIFFIAMTAISACQSVPKERKNNCACLWEMPVSMDDQSIGVST